jgi:hypothetical protein
MYSHVTTLTFTVTYEKIEPLKGHLLSFVVSYHLFVFFNNANTVSAEMWVWGFGNHAWYISLVKSLVFDSWLETFVSLVISKTPYSHFLLTVFTHCWKIEAILLWNNLSCKVRVMAQFLNQCTHMWLHWLLLSYMRKLNF